MKTLIPPRADLNSVSSAVASRASLPRISDASILISLPDKYRDGFGRDGVPNPDASWLFIPSYQVDSSGA